MGETPVPRDKEVEAKGYGRTIHVSATWVGRYPISFICNVGPSLYTLCILAVKEDGVLSRSVYTL